MTGEEIVKHLEDVFKLKRGSVSRKITEIVKPNETVLEMMRRLYEDHARGKRSE